MTKNIVVGDADILVGLYFEGDIHHQRIITINKLFLTKGVNILFPNTAIAEAITTLHRKLSHPIEAELLINHFQAGLFDIEYVSAEIMLDAATLYNPQGSKQNTFFDAIVAATAKSLQVDIIFSFDKWYKKQGFNLPFE